MATTSEMILSSHGWSDDVTTTPATVEEEVDAIITNDTAEEEVASACTRYCDLDRELGFDILWWLGLVVHPIIVICGTTGNIFSIVVLLKIGLKKSSNILLFCLAISDITFLLGSLGVYFIWKDCFRKPDLSATQAYILFVTNQFQNGISQFGNAVSQCISMFITLERLCAVYLPLKFNMIIRPGRTKIALMIVGTIAVFKAAVSSVAYKFVYRPESMDFHTAYSDFYVDNYEMYVVLLDIWLYLLNVIPVIVVTAGSILIGIKVALASQARAKMLSSGQDKEAMNARRTSRTTVTLLAVCVLFVFTIGVSFFIETFFEYEWTWAYYLMFSRIIFIIYSLNSSGNFVIYMALNNNFRAVYLELFNCCRSEKNEQQQKKSKLARASSGLN